MKKILFLLLFLLPLSVNAGYYSDGNFWYSSSSPVWPCGLNGSDWKPCESSAHITTMPWDGETDGINDNWTRSSIEVEITSNASQNSSILNGPVIKRSWDSTNPTWSVTYTNSWENSSQTISYSTWDDWWSWVDLIYLNVYEANISDNWNIGNFSWPTSIIRTVWSTSYTQSFNNKKAYRYSLTVIDLANNRIDTAIWTNILKMENEKPTGTLSYPSWWKNSNQTINFDWSDTWWSKLSKVNLIIYERDIEDDWSHLDINFHYHTTINWTTGVNSSINTYTQVKTHNKEYKYSLDISDAAGNVPTWGIIQGTNILQMDDTPPSSLDIDFTWTWTNWVNYWWTNSSKTIDISGTDLWGSMVESITVERFNRNNVDSAASFWVWWTTLTSTGWTTVNQSVISSKSFTELFDDWNSYSYRLTVTDEAWNSETLDEITSTHIIRFEWIDPHDVTISYFTWWASTNWWTNTFQVVTFKAKDIWHSNLKTITLNQKEKLHTDTSWPTAWSLKQSYSVSGNDETIFQTPTLVNGYDYKYQVVAIDNAWNETTIDWTNTIKYETDDPILTSLTYTDWWTNSSDLITIVAKDAWDSRLRNITLEESENWSWINPSPWTPASWIDMINQANDTNITYDTYSRLIVNGSNFQFKVKLEDYAGNINTTSYTLDSKVLKFDNETPEQLDVTQSIDVDSYYKTINSKQVVVTVAKDADNSQINWWAPITLIQTRFEKYNDKTSYSWTVTETSSPLTENLNIRSVDDDRNWNNYRDYKYQVTKILDEAGNSYTNPDTLPIGDFNNYTDNEIDYVYHIYANDTNITNSSVTWHWNFTWWNEVADWSEKTLQVTLKDQFNNMVVPVDWTWSYWPVRDVTLTTYYSNYLYLDQITNSGEWVMLTDFERSTYFDSTIWGTENEPTTFSNVSYDTWIYNMKFRVFAPTHSWWITTDWRKYAKWSFSINDVKSEVSDIAVESSDILWPQIDFDFKPIYYTTLGWELVGSWILEWWEQTLDIDLDINWSYIPDNHELYFLQSWSWYAIPHFTSVWRIKNSPWTLTWSNQNISRTIWNIWTKFIWSWTSPFSTVFSTAVDYILTTLFTIENIPWVYVNEIEDISLREYMSYTINRFGFTKTIKILAWWINMVDEQDTIIQNFKTLKIYWVTNIDKEKQKDLTDNQDAEHIQNLSWDITKSWLRRDIRKAAITTTKFVTSIDTGTSIQDLTWNIWDDTNNWWKVLWDILYYGWMNGSNVILWNNNDKTVSWRKTIVVVWWNLYIKSNIINNTSSDSNTLWIIVLKDENWNGWKIYMDRRVYQVDAIMYADKSLISYDDTYINESYIKNYWISEHEIAWNILNNLMQKQLYIYWSVFSENTVWWSKLDPPVCPFWTKSIPLTCNTVTAQTYDLSYLRLWVDSNSKSRLAWSQNYPVVIEYNSAVETTPPPLFSK